MAKVIILLLVLAVAGVAVFFAALHLRRIREINRERRAVRELQQQRNILINRLAARKLHHVLNDDETELLWLDRRHWVTAGQVMGWAAVAVLMVFLTVYLAASPLKLHIPAYGKNPERHLDLWYLWVVPFALCLASAGKAWTEWLMWSAEYRMLTNKRLVLVTQPYAVAFWLWNTEETNPLPLSAVTTVETKSTYWGRMLGYGSVVVKTLIPESEVDDFLEITYTRRYRQMKEEIDMAVKEAGIRLVAVGGTSIVPVEEGE